MGVDNCLFSRVNKESHCNHIQIRQKRMSRTFAKQENILGKERSIGKDMDLRTICDRPWVAKCLEQLDISHTFFRKMRLEMQVGTKYFVGWHEHIFRASRRLDNGDGQEGPIWKLCLRLNEENVIVGVSLVILLICGKNGKTMNKWCSHTANMAAFPFAVTGSIIKESVQ